jgi:hypothetical protein
MGHPAFLSLKQDGLPSQFAYPSRLLDAFTRRSIKSQTLGMTILRRVDENTQVGAHGQDGSRCLTSNPPSSHKFACKNRAT